MESKLTYPALEKFSLYWPILMASNHSSTVVTLNSGVDRSSLLEYKTQGFGTQYNKHDQK